MKRLFAAFTFILLFAVVFSGCTAQSPAGDDTESQAPTVITQEVEKVVTQEVEKVVTQEVEREVLITPTPAPRDTARYGGTFTEAWIETVSTLDPWATNQGILQKLGNRIYSRLVVVDENLRIQPDLAESWTVSDDAMTFTFTLHDTGQWHDGEPVTAEDVKFTFERAAYPDANSRWQPNAALVEGGQAYLDGEADEISGIEALDDYTVRFELTEPNVAFISTLHTAHIAPKHVFEDIPVDQVANSEYATEAPIGSGPWKVVNYVPDQAIELERHDGYFKEELPYIDRFVIRLFQNQAAAVAALEAGDVDVTPIDASDIERIERIDYLDVLRYDKHNSQIVTFNLDKEPWNNVQVRRAIAHAIDKQGVCQVAYLGACNVREHTFPQEWTWSPQADVHPYQPETARSMLEEAGFDFDREYTLLTYYSSPEPAAIQSLLAEIGVNVSVMALDAPAYLEERNTDSWDLQYIGFFRSVDPHERIESFSCAEEPNFFRYCSSEVQELLQTAATITDFEERQAVYQQVDQILQEELPWYPMFSAQDAYGYNLRVANFQYNPWYEYPETWYVFE